MIYFSILFLKNVKIFKIIFLIVCILYNIYNIYIYILIFYSIGRNIVHLINRPDDTYCFRLHNNRVYYVR